MEATRAALQAFGESLGANCAMGLEATICSHWIYNFLKPYSAQILMAQPAKLKALQAAKNKNDKLDARTLADLLRCNLFPECYVLPVDLEMLRRQLR
jgi:transposase